MKLKYLLSMVVASALYVACSSTPQKNEEETQTEVSADKEIKMEDVDEQLKTDQERMDSVKKELGIE